MLSLLSRFLLHALACLAFPLLLGLGFALYYRYVGRPVSHGASIGLATWLVYYVFIFFNLLMAAFARNTIRWALVLLLGALVLWYFGMQHPVRALSFSALSVGLCSVAIIVTPLLTALLRRLREAGRRVC